MKTLKNWKQFNEGFMDFFKGKESDEDKIVKHLIDNIDEITDIDTQRMDFFFKYKKRRYRINYSNYDIDFYGGVTDEKKGNVVIFSRIGNIQSKYGKKLYNLLSGKNKEEIKKKDTRNIPKLKDELNIESSQFNEGDLSDDLDVIRYLIEYDNEWGAGRQTYIEAKNREEAKEKFYKTHHSATICYISPI